MTIYLEALQKINEMREDIELKMITDPAYYDKAVERLRRKGKLPKPDKLQQAKLHTIYEKHYTNEHTREA